MKNKILKIDADDNVFVALTDLMPNEKLVYGGKEIFVGEKVKAKHKFSAVELNKGAEIRMYGNLIGKATKAIPAGHVLTVDNVVHSVNAVPIKKKTPSWQAPDVTKWSQRHFMGYHRSDGQVGTANTWLVVPLVFCENRNVETMKDTFLQELGFARQNPYREYVRALVANFQDGADMPIDSVQMLSDDHKVAKLFDVFIVVIFKVKQ